MTTHQYAGATRFTLILFGALALAVSILGAGGRLDAAHSVEAATPSPSYSFTAISNPLDTTFTQLLGVNKAGLIAGYDGSGADAQHPNKGFVLHLPTTFVPSNFPGSAQTQVIGIDDHGNTDGFYVDMAGVTHGFTDVQGTFTTVDVPGSTFDQLLGLNNKGEVAGYYAFGPTATQTFVPFIRRADHSIVLLPIANAQATGINDQELVSGFYNDAMGNSHGFLWQSGTPLRTVDFPGAVSTQLLGLNATGQAVGSYTDNQNVAHGFVYNIHSKLLTPIDMPGSTSTVVNGINSRGWLVGFFTNADNNTLGFVALPGGVITSTTGMPTQTPTSTPATMPTTPTTTASRFTTSVGLSVTSNVTTVRIPVSFSVTVSPNQATGTVELRDGVTQIASGQLRNGVVTFRSVSLSGGTRQVSAQYLGDTMFQPSVSSIVTVRVNLGS